MNTFRKKWGKTAGLAGAAALVAACIPCCVALAAPLLAWLGITSLGGMATGWYAGALVAFTIGTAAILFVRYRRSACCRPAPVKGACGCGGACKV